MQTFLGEPASPPAAVLERRRTADLVFKGALIFNTSLTAFWLVMLATGGNAFFFGNYDVSLEAVGRVLGACCSSTSCGGSSGTASRRSC